MFFHGLLYRILSKDSTILVSETSTLQWLGQKGLFCDGGFELHFAKLIIFPVSFL